MGASTAYRETMAYLYERLPMFSRQGKAALKPDLTNTLKLCKALDDPQEQFKSIHIAGTNGKGSTSHMMAAVLQEHGYKIGLYTSPHLIDFRERILINGKAVSEDWVVAFVAKHKEIIEQIQPSFFEITVAMAFQVFKEEEVDIAVIETGLGGRLDSTNVITPILSIITNISYDHKDLLGNTLKEIAKEKAGIIKTLVPVVVGEQHDETESVFFETAIRKQTTIYYAEALWDLVRTGQSDSYQYFKAVRKAHREMYDLQTDILGTYQQHNIKTVLAAVETLVANQGLDLSLSITLRALTKVKRLTVLRGRWERLGSEPLIIADVGHNAAGIKEVMAQWQQVDAVKKHIVAGFVNDKDIDEALALFPKDCTYHFCNASIPRALPVESIRPIAEAHNLQGNYYSSVADAVKGAFVMMNDQDAMLITGSFFIVGEAIEYLEAVTKPTKEDLAANS